MLKIPKDKLGAQIINGALLAENINTQTCAQIFQEKIAPGVAVILVGDNPSSKLYVNLKKKACDKVRIDFHLYEFHDNYSDEQIIEVIQYLNQDSEINAILVQLPLPEKLDESKIINAIAPNKDVDGFHPENLAKIKMGKPSILSPLTLGVDAMIQETKINLENKKIVVLANHDLIAIPFNYLYGQKNIVAYVHPDDLNAQKKCHDADILIVAIGRPQYVNNEFVKHGAVVIDIGINKLGDKTVGDVDFDNVMLKTSFISPVPGGVGPMTIAFLLKNTIDLYHQQNKN